MNQGVEASKLPTVLLLTTDNPLTREIARALLESGFQVKAVGTSEKVLGVLNSKPNFQFHKINLAKQPIIRSYLYGLDYVIYLDRDLDLLDKIRHTYQSLEHFKSKPPGLLFLSSSRVFSSPKEDDNLENSPKNPTTQLGSDYCAAEDVVSSYSQNLQTRACIIRIPPIWDPSLTDEPFANLSQLLRQHKPLSMIQEDPIYIQWVQIHDLFTLLELLLKSQWSGLETIHYYSYSAFLPDVIGEICSAMGSRSQLKEIKKAPSFLQSLVVRSPTLKQNLESIMKWEDLGFLNLPPLGMEQTLRLIEKPRLKIGSFLSSFSRRGR